MWILDASVIVKWFFTDEPLRENALQVQRHAVTNPKEFIIPHLCYSELLQVLARKSNNDLVFLNRSLDLITRMGLRTFWLSNDALLKAAEFSCLGLSGYDATYLALAHDLKGYWLTADQKALKKNLSPHILSLNNWRFES
ncbi:MAG: type II toxin-antitoxin system VapC family toxin [Myxococcaceae bacterium]